MRNGPFNFSIEITTQKIPEGLYGLKNQACLHEGFMFTNEEDLISGNHVGTHLCIRNKQGNLVASMLGCPATQSPFSKITGHTPPDISELFYITQGVTIPEYQSQYELRTLLTYLTFREGIKQGYSDSISLYENKENIEKIMDIQWLTNIPNVIYINESSQHKLYPGRANLAYGMNESWEILPDETREYLASNALSQPHLSIA